MNLSIILINYNSLDYTINCINSIVTSNVNIDFEIIVVDNASEINPGPVLMNTFPGLCLVRSEINLGFAGGNNLGISYAKGDTILLLNNDTLVGAGSIEIPYHILHTNPKIGAITCQLRYPDGRIQHNCQSFPSKKKEYIEKWRLHKLMSKSKKSSYMQGFYFDYTRPGTPDWIWGTYFMFRKKTLDRLPGQKLNDEYFMYIEDMQWCWDIRKAGFEVYYTPNACITHFGGGSGGAKDELMQKNLDIFIKKNRVQ